MPNISICNRKNKKEDQLRREKSDWALKEISPVISLVGMHTSTATMENSVEIPLKTGNRTAILPSSPIPEHTH